MHLFDKLSDDHLGRPGKGMQDDHRYLSRYLIYLPFYTQETLSPTFFSPPLL